MNRGARCPTTLSASAAGRRDRRKTAGANRLPRTHLLRACFFPAAFLPGPAFSCSAPKRRLPYFSVRYPRTKGNWARRLTPRPQHASLGKLEVERQ